MQTWSRMEDEIREGEAPVDGGTTDAVDTATGGDAGAAGANTDVTV